ncbi:MAG: glucosaminidase domain-containing protein [Ferrimonas sp.]
MIKTGRVRQVTFALSCVAFATIVAASQWPSDLLEQQLNLPLQKNTPRSAVPQFAQINNVNEKKQAFFNYLRPKIELQNARIQTERQTLLRVLDKMQRNRTLSNSDKEALTAISLRYRWELRSLDVSGLQQLLSRVDTLPVEMVLIQAANETGWGSSRFAIEGNNYFGQWCFTAGCGLVPQARSTGMNHEVARFADADGSIASYLLNLNTNAAYQGLRQRRAELHQQQQSVTATELIPTLLAYSERKQEYVDELLAMLRQNRHLL